MLLGLFAAFLCAQTAPQETELRLEPGVVTGMVFGQDTGKALKRARVFLRPEDGSATLGVTTDDNGQFTFQKVKAGRYALTVRRDGYLTAWSGQIGSTRLPLFFVVGMGRRIDGIVISMRPSAVISGKVKYNDAEPARNVLVQAYQQYYYRNRHGFRIMARAQTNDLGEYRIYDLPPGSYYVAAAYASPVHVAGVNEQPRTDPEGRPVPEESFVTTFYPSSTTLTGAVPVRVGYGTELSTVDVFLTPVRTVRIGGRVTSGVTGQELRASTFTLRRPDVTNMGSITAPVSLNPNAVEGFEIAGVPSGVYHLQVDATENGKRLSARRTITVVEGAIENMEIVLSPPREWKGHIRLRPEARVAFSKLMLSFESRTEGAPALSAAIEKDGSFTASLMPGETYDLFLSNAPPGLYVESARTGSLDVLANGIPDAGEAPIALEVTLGTRGAEVLGGVTLDGTHAAVGATVLLAPDPLAGRLQSLQLTSSDEYGRFMFQGVAPGSYLLLSWLDEPACDFYNPRAQEDCRRLAVTLTVDEGGRHESALRLTGPPESQ